MATTLCFINQKGGATKTTTCFHLAGAFAASGLRVLVVDIDPQGSMTQAFLGSDVTKYLPLESTMGVLFSDDHFFVDSSLIQQSGFHNIQFCPSNLQAARFNDPDPDRWGMKQHCVAEFLQQHAVEYDLVLIDCPPNLYLCSWAAMVASDYVVIPVPPEEFGTQGLEAVHQAIDQVRTLNPNLRRLGHIITLRDARLLIHRHIENKMRTFHKNEVFETVISKLKDYPMANSARLPVEHYAPRSHAANLTRRLSREILDRIAEKTARRRVA